MAEVLDLISRVQMRVPKCPPLVVRDAYVAAVRLWCGQTRWHRERLEATLTPNVATYNIEPDPFLEIVDIPSAQLQVVTSGRSNIVPLKPSDPHSFDPNQPAKQPRTYAYLPESAITFYYTPNKDYAVTLELAVQPTRSTTEISDVMLAKHWAAFESGALAYLLQLNEPWKDPVTAAREDAIFKSSVSNAKADVIRGFQSGTVMIRKRAFIV